MSSELSAKIVSVNIPELPAEITSVLEHVEKCRKQAQETPGKVVRVNAGYYFLFTNNVMWEIDSSTERPASDRWVARTKDDAHYAYTLKELVNYLTSEVYEKLKDNFSRVTRYSNGSYLVIRCSALSLPIETPLWIKLEDCIGAYKTIATKSYTSGKWYYEKINFRI